MDTTTVEVLANIPVLPFASPHAWAEWLAEHHAEPGGVWLKLAKKETGIPSLTYAEALDEALCYGWIDGQKKGYDERFWLQKFTPRRRGSGWSKVNTEHVARLIAEGRMQPAGLREVEAAKADGRWDAAYAPQSQASAPDDFLAALDENPRAKAFHATLNKANRYAIYYRIRTAKRPETRQARIAQIVTMLANHETPHPQLQSSRRD
jgi:uncharacterized protein YdeI (YjbR/CyaY-like superfamily)